MPDQTDRRNASILATLRSAEAQRIDFHLGPWHIDGAAFERVAIAIEAGDIQIRDKPPANDDVEAQYDHFNDYILVPPTFYARTAGERAALIHECVHAFVDMLDIKGEAESSNEAAAFLAMFLYRLNGRDAIPSATGGESNVRLVTTAVNIARQMKKHPGAAVPNSDAAELRQSIVTHPRYQNNGMTYDSPNVSEGLFRWKLRRKGENYNDRGKTDLNRTKNLPSGSRLA